MNIPVNLPDAANVPDGKKRSDTLDVPNWAEKKEVTAQVVELARKYFQKFQTQSARTRFEERMKRADQIFQMSENQSKQTKNKTDVEIDTVPDIGYRVLRAITSNELDILYPENKPSYIYEADDTIDPVERGDAEYAAEQWNQLASYTKEVDHRFETMHKMLWSVNKYSTLVIGIEWNEETHTVKERYAKKRSDSGIPTEIGWRTKDKTRAFPSWKVFDMKDVWFDANIDDMQKQQCVIVRSYPILDDIIKGQQRGYYKNAAKIKPGHFYHSQGRSSVLSDRRVNAGSSGDEDTATGELDRFDVFIRVPIDENGKYAPKKMYSSWHWLTVLGYLDSNDTLCIRLNPLAFNDGEIPLKIIHSHPDDIGAFHRGYLDFIEPAWNEYKTTLDEWFQNKELVNNAPWKMEKGALLNDDKRFGHHKIFQMAYGKFEKLERFRVPPNTSDIQPFISYLEARIQDAAGVNNPFLGQGLGSRASASEARNVFEQAIKPATQKMRYIASQIKWLAEKDVFYWQQFSSLDMCVAITGHEIVNIIKPTTLYGNVRVKVVSISESIKTIMKQQEQDRFLATTFPLIVQLLGRDALSVIAPIYEDRGIPLMQFVPQPQEADAIHVAMSENIGLLDDGIWDEPKMGENNDIHLRIHRPAYVRAKADPEKDSTKLNMMDLHIKIHEQNQNQANEALSSMAQNMQKPIGLGESGAVQNEGQAMRSILSAEGGAMQ